MIKSMTGFAAFTEDDDAVTVAVTIKAVNHRFLDAQLRLPSALVRMETRVRSLLASSGHF